MVKVAYADSLQTHKQEMVLELLSNYLTAVGYRDLLAVKLQGLTNAETYCLQVKLSTNLGATIWQEEKEAISDQMQVAQPKLSETDVLYQPQRQSPLKWQNLNKPSRQQLPSQKRCMPK